jgi:hypothetical protein
MKILIHWHVMPSFIDIRPRVLKYLFTHNAMTLGSMAGDCAVGAGGYDQNTLFRIVTNHGTQFLLFSWAVLTGYERLRQECAFEKKI